MFLFALLNVLVGFSTYRLAEILFSQERLIDFCLSWFTLFFAQVVIVELFLGLLRILYLPNIILLHLAIFLIVYLTTRRNARFKLELPKIKFIFENKILLFAIAIFVGFFMVKFWINLINPPICPESLQYHLSFPANWIKNGNLNNPISIFGSRPTSAELTALTYYPMNAELLFFWWMLPLRNAFLADVGQAVFYILGIMAVYSILRKYAIKRDTALFIGFLWALIPNLFKQIRMGTQIDVMCAALFLIILNNLLILNKEFKLKNAFIFGVSLGLFVGTKVLNIYWCIALLPLIFYFIINKLKKYSLRSVFSIFLLIVSMLFMFGSFSYIRTFLLTGNPLYPVTVSIFGKSIFAGIIDKDNFSKIFVPWNEFSIRDILFCEGLGVQFLVFILPGTIIPLLAAVFVKRKFQNITEYIMLFLIPTIMFWMYFFIIKAYWVRYFFPYLGMGLITCAIFLDKFKYGRKYMTVFGFICIVSSAAELAHRYELVTSFIIALVLFAFLLLFRKSMIGDLKSKLSLRKLLFVVLVSFGILFFLNEKYDREEFKRYPLLSKGKEAGGRFIGYAWDWLNENTGTGGKNIAYTGRSEFYPLFGRGLKNNVMYVSINNKLPFVHYYPDGLYRKEKDYDSWMNNLRKEKIDYLFVALPHEGNNESDDFSKFPIEDEWAVFHPKYFDLVFNNCQARIYKFFSRH